MNFLMREQYVPHELKNPVLWAADGSKIPCAFNSKEKTVAGTGIETTDVQRESSDLTITLHLRHMKPGFRGTLMKVSVLYSWATTRNF